MSHPRTKIQLDLASNSLQLELDPPLPLNGKVDALIDLATRGVLLGIDFGESYVALAQPSTTVSGLERTATITVELSDQGSRLVIPRRGEGWEISYPSGNQCWRSANGDERIECELIPAVVTFD